METTRMDCDDALARLRQAHGQLGGLIHMIEEGRGSAEVLTLLAAITHALHRAGFRLVADGLQACRDEPRATDGTSIEQLKKLFVALG